jgi:hypothetical protein
VGIVFALLPYFLSVYRVLAICDHSFSCIVPLAHDRLSVIPLKTTLLSSAQLFVSRWSFLIPPFEQFDYVQEAMVRPVSVAVSPSATMVVIA